LSNGTAPERIGGGKQAGSKVVSFVVVLLFGFLLVFAVAVFVFPPLFNLEFPPARRRHRRLRWN